MLRVTFDIFSGRLNPSMYISDPDTVTDILKRIARNRSVISPKFEGFDGLGFRGIQIELMEDDLERRYALPRSFKIATGASNDEGKGLEIAEMLIKLAGNFHQSSVGEKHDIIDDSIIQYMLHTINLLEIPSYKTIATKNADLQHVLPLPDGVCTIEATAYNPAYWNTDPSITSQNNCYNFGRNHRTDTFAQPGKYSGYRPKSISVAEYSSAAISDGAHRRQDCQPDTEKPRWLVALVIAPGLDFHWYRFHEEGFWAHKPGQTPVRNVDNRGVTITNPETCARGSYTDFGGYFYAPYSMHIK